MTPPSASCSSRAPPTCPLPAADWGTVERHQRSSAFMWPSSTRWRICCPRAAVVPSGPPNQGPVTLHPTLPPRPNAQHTSIQPTSLSPLSHPLPTRPPGHLRGRPAGVHRQPARDHLPLRRLPGLHPHRGQRPRGGRAGGVVALALMGTPLGVCNRNCHAEAAPVGLLLSPQEHEIHASMKHRTLESIDSDCLIR